MRNKLRPILKCCAGVLLLWFGGFTAANAITIRGIADPMFTAGGDFNGDIWSALVQFGDADASCVSGVNFTDPTGHICAPDAGTLVMTGTLSDGSSTVDLNFLFTGPAPSISITTLNGVATGIQTGVVGPTAEFNLGSQGFAWVDFEFGSHFDLSAPSGVQILLQSCRTSEEEFTWNSWEDEGCTANVNNALRSTPDSVTVTQTTPEPGILWLVFSALSMGWLMRRRAQFH